MGKFGEVKNPNYAATVVTLNKFVDLPNCNNVKAAIIFGNSVIVSKDSTAGSLGVFFPVECQISKEFLSVNSLYRKPEWGSVDPTKTGFFEEKGRVKAVKFRGHKSEGFWVPINYLDYLNSETFSEGDIFEQVDGHEICKKYIPTAQYAKADSSQTKGKQPKLEDSIVDGQFRFHFDTENFRRNSWKVKPQDWISITDKWHGTSVVIAKLLVKKELNWIERLLRKVKVDIVETTYGMAYSSRRVIKEVNGQSKFNQHFYKTDIWGCVAYEVADLIPAGFTLYGEIVGYTVDGAPIQKGYTYGCSPGGHKLVIYRVTSTNAEGKTLELTWPQVQEFCQSKGLETVPTLYYGLAGIWVYEAQNGHFDEEHHWNENFLQVLEKKYVNDGMCPYNDNKVPAEGIVIRVDHLAECESFKLKNFKFLEFESKELDKGEVDTETMESVGV